jgi:hypothetical protein
MEDMKSLSQDYIGKNLSVCKKLSHIWKCLEQKRWGFLWRFRVYQNKCVNGIFKKLKNNLVAEPVGPVKNGFLFFTSP